MRFLAAFKLLGIMLMVLSVCQLPPLVVGYLYQDGGISAFVFSFVVNFLFGFVLWFSTRGLAPELKPRDGFLVVSALWIVLIIFGAIPFIVVLYPKMSVINALFEAASGLTTTGATSLMNFSGIAHSIMYYRMQLHLLGGMGIIVLAVAVLPMLGIGGMQLYRAEVASVTGSTKLTPRLAQTAKTLWMLYFGLSLIAIVVFRLVGLDWFDALAASFTTVSTGGFSLHASGFAYYNSVAVDVVAIFFMLLGATNFSLHFHFLRQRTLLVYWRDPEFRCFVFFYLFLAIVVGVILSVNGYSHIGRNLLNAVFTVFALGTTTGLTITNFDLWPNFVPYLLMFIALVGGCAGSTAGGLKMVRAMVLSAQSRREMHRLIHPNGVYAVKLGKQVLPERTLQAVWGYVAAFFALFVVMFLMLLSLDLDARSAFGALVACFTNAGAGIGQVAAGFSMLPTPAKCILIFAMIAGRLEIFTMLVLFMPSYWAD